MGKVNINEAKATETARKGDAAEPKRGKGSEQKRVNIADDSKVEKNVGVKMTAKENASKSDNVGGAKKDSSKSLATTREIAVISRKPTIKMVEKPKNIKIHEPEVDEGMALMASRTSAAEFQKPDIAKLRQQRGKSMSGMLVEGVRPVSKTQAMGSSEKGENSEAEKKTDSAEEKEKFSKMSSVLIGVGVAVVVAVIGFAAIAIFGNNKEKCMVNFESNGGSKIESTEIVCGRTVKRPTDPTKDGFEFEGWILDGDPFDFENEIYKNAVLVARWKADDDTEIVKVSFDTDGGTAVSPVEVAKGKTMHEPKAPTKANWAFTGWYLGDEKFDFSKPIDGDITLKAGWKWSPAASSNGGGNTTTRPSGSSGNSGNSGNSGTGNDKPTVDDQNTGNTGNNGGNTGDDNQPGQDNNGGNEGDGDDDNKPTTPTEPTTPEGPGEGNEDDEKDPKPEQPEKPTTPEGPGTEGEGGGGTGGEVTPAD